MKLKFLFMLILVILSCSKQPKNYDVKNYTDLNYTNININDSNFTVGVNIDTLFHNKFKNQFDSNSFYLKKIKGYMSNIFFEIFRIVQINKNNDVWIEFFDNNGYNLAQQKFGKVYNTVIILRKSKNKAISIRWRNKLGEFDNGWFYPWEINNLTDTVYTNLNKDIISYIFPTFKGIVKFDTVKSINFKLVSNKTNDSMLYSCYKNFPLFEFYNNIFFDRNN